MQFLRLMLPSDAVKRLLLVALLALWAISCINLPHPKYFAMQHVPTVLALVALVIIEKKQPLDRLSYSLIIAFLLLHILGARYLYSYVPYDDWSQRLFDFSITERFGFERNHYDRLVHFCFGLLFAYPLWKYFDWRLGLSAAWSGLLAICIVLAASAVYEIGEWATAMTFAPDWAEAYNGQQGDVWDAQCDMALAALGASFGIAVVGLFKNNHE